MDIYGRCVVMCVYKNEPKLAIEEDVGRESCEILWNMYNSVMEYA